MEDTEYATATTVTLCFASSPPLSVFPSLNAKEKKKNKQATPLSSSSGGSCLFIALSPSTSFSQSSNNPKRAEDLTARRLSCLFIFKKEAGEKKAVP